MVSRPYSLHCTPLVLALLSGSSFAACAAPRALNQPSQPPSRAELASLWQPPADLESRNLFYGPGGSQLVPRAGTFAFVARKTSGINKGYDVRDAQGRKWAVKLGDEAQSEVTVSRILWAIGFHQPPVYYVPRWQLSRDGVKPQKPARFRAEFEPGEVVGEWSWYDNPFVGTRPFAALIAVNMLFHNWDLKTPNNKLYVVSRPGRTGAERLYVVRDLGASLGRASQPRPLAWFPFVRLFQGSKNNVEDFEAQGFVREIDGERVEFDYRGLDSALVDSVRVADLGWTVALLSRLSRTQWLDAFRAGGYSQEDSERYLTTIERKLGRAQRLAEEPPGGLALRRAECKLARPRSGRSCRCDRAHRSIGRRFAAHGGSLSDHEGRIDTSLLRRIDSLGSRRSGCPRPLTPPAENALLELLGQSAQREFRRRY